MINNKIEKTEIFNEVCNAILVKADGLDIDLGSQLDDYNPITRKLEPASHCMSECFTALRNFAAKLHNEVAPCLNLDQIPIISEEEYSRKLADFLGRKNYNDTKQKYFSLNHNSMISIEFKQQMSPFRFPLRSIDYNQMINTWKATYMPFVVSTMATKQGHIMIYDGTFMDPFGNPIHTIAPGPVRYTPSDPKLGSVKFVCSPEFAKSMLFRTMIDGVTSKMDVKVITTSIEINIPFLREMIEELEPSTNFDESFARICDQSSDSIKARMIYEKVLFHS